WPITKHREGISLERACPLRAMFVVFPRRVVGLQKLMGGFFERQIVGRLAALGLTFLAPRLQGVDLIGQLLASGFGPRPRVCQVKVASRAKAHEAGTVMELVSEFPVRGLAAFHN